MTSMRVIWAAIVLAGCAVLPGGAMAQDLLFYDGLETGGGGVITECPDPGFPVPAVFTYNGIIHRIGFDYADVFGPWSVSSGTIHWTMGSFQFASLAFTVPDNPDAMFSKLTWDQLDGNPETVEIAVSQCAGNPSMVPTDDYCYTLQQGRSGGFRMANVHVPGLERCALSPGNYYLNVRFNGIWNVTEH